MITTADLLAGLQRETDIIKHLGAKAAAGPLDFRLSAGQRSTRELLQYLTHCAIVPAYAMVDGEWTRGEAAEERQQAAFSVESFAACMDRQMDELRGLLAEVTPQAARERTTRLPWGEEVSLGTALVEAVWKSFTTYRVQLFLQLKAGGRRELGSTNLWMGREPAPAR